MTTTKYWGRCCLWLWECNGAVRAMSADSPSGQCSFASRFKSALAKRAFSNSAWSVRLHTVVLCCGQSKNSGMAVSLKMAFHRAVILTLPNVVTL